MNIGDVSIFEFQSPSFSSTLIHSTLRFMTIWGDYRYNKATPNASSGRTLGYAMTQLPWGHTIGVLSGQLGLVGWRKVIYCEICILLVMEDQQCWLVDQNI